MLISLDYKVIQGEEVIEKKIEFSSSLLNSDYTLESLFAVTVEGESMQPLILNNSLVIADLSQKTLVDEAIYLLYYGSKMWIKRYKQVEDESTFISINPDFSHLIYPASQCHLIGRVLLTFTKL